MEKIFSGYLSIGGVVIKQDGYDVLVKEIGEDEYQELITGETFRNFRCGGKDISVCLCYRLDSTLQSNSIRVYLRYEADRVRRIIDSLKPRTHLKVKDTYK